MNAVGGSLVGKTIAVLGLTFKANTDDTRESPAIAVIERLIGRGGKVVAYDPMVSKYALAGLSVAESPIAAATGAHALVVLTEWTEFSELSSRTILDVMSSKVVVDTRNVLDQKAWQESGAIFPVSSSPTRSA
jgi:UDPglucose 6-dehydrogenase